MSRKDVWGWNSLTNHYLYPGGSTIEPELTVKEKVYSRPIVIYGAKGQELVRKENPDKALFGFVKE